MHIDSDGETILDTTEELRRFTNKVGCPLCRSDALNMLDFLSDKRAVKLTFTTTCEHGMSNVVRDPSWPKV